MRIKNKLKDEAEVASSFNYSDLCFSKLCSQM